MSTASNANWGRRGSTWRRLHARVRAQGDPCWRCNRPINYDAPPRAPQSFSVDHIIPLSVDPSLAHDMDNLRAAHFSCNAAYGNGTKTPKTKSGHAHDYHSTPHATGNRQRHTRISHTVNTLVNRHREQQQIHSLALPRDAATAQRTGPASPQVRPLPQCQGGIGWGHGHLRKNFNPIHPSSYKSSLSPRAKPSSQCVIG